VGYYKASGKEKRLMDEKDVRRVNEVIEDLTEAARESYKTAVDQAFAARESNMRLARSFFEDWTDTLEAQAELNRRTLQSLAEQVRRNQEVFRKLSRNSLNAYDGFLDSLYSYYEEVSKEPKEPGG
jgi:hypothetical protein